MPTSARFHPGQICSTPGVLAATTATQLLEALKRHLSGDWGDVSLEDGRANEEALQHNLRVMSVYALENGSKLWIITEADRSTTTILLPSEY